HALAIYVSCPLSLHDALPIGQVADTRAAAGARLDADVDDAAARLAEASGEGEPAGITEAAQERLADGLAQAANVPAIARAAGRRSEEHTSELQSRENLVCRLL